MKRPSAGNSRRLAAHLTPMFQNPAPTPLSFRKEAQIGRALASIVLLLMVCTLAFGQKSGDRIEVFGGYSLVTGDFTGTYADQNTHRLNGWEGAATFKVNRWLGATADFSGFYASYTFPGIQPLTIRARSLGYLFGPQISLPSARFTPFAHFLLGATRVGYPAPSGCPLCAPSPANSLTFAAGGGVDIAVAKHVAVRGQVDLLHSGFSNADNQLLSRYHETNMRISTGLVFRF